MKSAHIRQESADEHVFIVVECPELPVISIDISSPHNRRNLDVRINGMGIFGMALDIRELPANRSEKMFRYCPLCGDKLNLMSSRAHKCKEVEDE